MIDPSQISLALIALIGVIIAPIISGFLNDRQARRRERHAYIDATVQALIEVRSKLQYFQLPGWAISRFPEEFAKAENEAQERAMRDQFQQLVEGESYKEMEVNFGKAYAIMVSIDNPDIRARAAEVLDQNQYPNAKLKVIDFALEQLGKQYKFKM